MYLSYIIIIILLVLFLVTAYKKSEKNVQYKNTKFDVFDEEEFQSIMNESDCANFLQSMGINV